MKVTPLKTMPSEPCENNLKFNARNLSNNNKNNNNWDNENDYLGEFK